MKIFVLCSFIFICVSPLLLHTVNGDYGGQTSEEKPSLSQRFREIALELGKTSHSSWGRVKSVVYQVQEKFFPPSLDFRTRDGTANVEGDGKKTAATRMTDAVEKSIGSSGSAFEETAASMSNIVGEAVHKTTEKVKESMSDKNEDGDKKDEL